jgi:hypothetical protein
MMCKNIIILFIAVFCVSCNSDNDKQELLNNDICIQLEEKLYTSNYLISLENRTLYNVFEQKYILDSLKYRNSYKAANKLFEINTNVIRKIGFIRHDFLMNLKGNEEYSVDTLFLHHINNKEDMVYTNLFYKNVFREEKGELEKLYVELDELSTSHKWRNLESMETIWNKENYTAAEFITGLTLTENLFVSHILYCFNRLGLSSAESSN